MNSHRRHHASTAGTSTAIPQDWQVDAACRDMPTDFFYPEGRGAHLVRQREEAKRFCRDMCPVIEQCREASVEERHGVWAGLDEADRGYDPRGVRRKAA